MMRLRERGRKNEDKKDRKHEKSETRRRKRGDQRDFPNGNGERESVDGRWRLERLIQFPAKTDKWCLMAVSYLRSSLTF